MRNLKAVFWDVDGTIADTEMNGHRVAFNKAFADFEFWKSIIFYIWGMKTILWIYLIVLGY